MPIFRTAFPQREFLPTVIFGTVAKSVMQRQSDGDVSRRKHFPSPNKDQGLNRVSTVFFVHDRVTNPMRNCTSRRGSTTKTVGRVFLWPTSSISRVCRAIRPNDVSNDPSSHAFSRRYFPLRHHRRFSWRVRVWLRVQLRGVQDPLAFAQSRHAAD